ncbi:MAG: nucleotide exchange factor GrpE [Muribaculaceae bacterium]|nr:nucleotide exchange factor GrpE [Muribaculaceae bacterium]
MNENNKKFHDRREDPEVVQPEDIEISDDFAAETDESADQADSEVAAEKDEVEDLKEQLAKEKKEYLFLMAEFDNFRKRTLKEKSEIIRNAGENVLKGLLPIVDDFERGLKAAANAESAQEVDEGMQLIYNKLVKYLNANGVKEFDPSDNVYDADRHEAISVVPVQDEEQKGKILDTVEKGYMINDKVLRHAKVVVGQ